MEGDLGKVWGKDLGEGRVLGEVDEKVVGVEGSVVGECEM